LGRAPFRIFWVVLGYNSVQCTNFHLASWCQQC
jgi:hypothetical protein